MSIRTIISSLNRDILLIVYRYIFDTNLRVLNKQFHNTIFFDKRRDITRIYNPPRTIINDRHRDFITQKWVRERGHSPEVIRHYVFGSMITYKDTGARLPKNY